MSKKKVLFITSNRIGDATLSTSLLNFLIVKFPDSHLTIVCGQSCAPLFNYVPGLKNLLPIEKKPFGLHWFKIWFYCLFVRWDLIVDLRSSLISLFLFSRKRRIFRKSNLSKNQHQVEQFANFFDIKSPLSLKIWLSEREKNIANKIVPKDVSVLAICPTAHWSKKRWPVNKFSELIKRLVATEGHFCGSKIMLIGADYERKLVEPILNDLNNFQVIDLVGKYDIITVYACLERAKFFIGNDTSIMHLAAAANIPTIGIFGPTPASVYGPWGDKTSIVTAGNNLNGSGCIEDIEVNEVESLVNTMIESN